MLRVLQRVLCPGPSLFARIDARNPGYFFNVTMAPMLLFASLSALITVLATWWTARTIPQVRGRTAAALAAVLVAAAMAMGRALYARLAILAWVDQVAETPRRFPLRRIPGAGALLAAPGTLPACPMRPQRPSVSVPSAGRTHALAARGRPGGAARPGCLCGWHWRSLGPRW